MLPKCCKANPGIMIQRMFDPTLSLFAKPLIAAGFALAVLPLAAEDLPRDVARVLQ